MRSPWLSLVIGRLEDFARRVHDRMADADWDTRRELIRLLAKRVEIGCDDANIVFRINPAPARPDEHQARAAPPGDDGGYGGMHAVAGGGHHAALA